jgi:hypothetical protein
MSCGHRVLVSCVGQPRAQVGQGAEQGRGIVAGQFGVHAVGLTLSCGAEPRQRTGLAGQLAQFGGVLAGPGGDCHPLVDYRIVVGWTT